MTTLHTILVLLFESNCTFRHGYYSVSHLWPNFWTGPF